MDKKKKVQFYISSGDMFWFALIFWVTFWAVSIPAGILASVFLEVIKRLL